MPLTIYTGGAKGVDTHVERLCHLYGHSCVVLILPCHPRAKSLAPLTRPDLDAATPTVTQAAFRLGRHVSHPITLQYPQRNYYVIKPASLVLRWGILTSYASMCWAVRVGVWSWLRYLANTSMCLIWIWNSGIGGIPPYNTINHVKA